MITGNVVTAEGFLDERTIDWHIPVRCQSGFDGQLPLPQSVVPNSDSVLAIGRALLYSDAHIVALVGLAGTGKTTCLGWLLRSLPEIPLDVAVRTFRCSSRSAADLAEFLDSSSQLTERLLLIIDGLDEMRDSWQGSLDELLEPVVPRLRGGDIKIVLSSRPDSARPLLVPPGRNLLGTLEWGEVWAGINTAAGLRVAILQLQELRPSDVELYAARRGLSSGFIAHLRSLYDLRELVRRFFLLVKLCDLSAQLDLDVWKRIHDRNELYEQLLTAWLGQERNRAEDLRLTPQQLLSVLEFLAIRIDRWVFPIGVLLQGRVAEVLAGLEAAELRGAAPTVLAKSLVEANILVESGFAHTSMEEYLIARALAGLIQSRSSGPVAHSQVSPEVIGFMVENRDFRAWLDQNQDALGQIDKEYLPYVLKICHRQGRTIPALDLRGADLSNVQLAGVRFRSATLRETNLEGAQLGPADLSDADLRGANLRHTQVWTTSPALEIFPSADDRDRIWILRPSMVPQTAEAALVQIGFPEARIVCYHDYEPRRERISSDNNCLFRIPNSVSSKMSEATQWIGENFAPEICRVLPRSLLMASVSTPGTVWNVGPDQLVLTSPDREDRVLTHALRSVRGAFAVVARSPLSDRNIEGLCVLGNGLFVITTDSHFQLSDHIPFDRSPKQLVAIGTTRVIFRTTDGWFSWDPEAEHPISMAELEDVTQVVAVPGGGFALIRSKSVTFVDEDLKNPVNQDTPDHPYLDALAIRRQNRRALVVLSNSRQWLEIIDEVTGLEEPGWIGLRAKGARFDDQTTLSPELRGLLTSAGARDESLLTVMPRIDVLSDPVTAEEPQFDVLLFTVNEREFDAVYSLAEQKLGKDPVSVPLRKRNYFDLGTIGGVRVGLVRSQMGSTQPGATIVTAMQALNEVRPRFLIAVGIAFGVDDEKQPLGQILYSEMLQDYNLLRIGTDENTGLRQIRPRGNKVSANPVFFNRVQAAADMWRRTYPHLSIKPVLLLSGDKLVDNYDYRQDLLHYFPDAEGGEMEGTGLYTASRETEAIWMVVKAISDYADGKKRLNKEARQKAAASNAAAFVFYFLERAQLERL